MHEVETAFYQGEAAWHRVGTVIDSTVDNTADGIKYSGLDWEVECRPIFIDADGTLARVKNHYATVRTSDNKVLGIVGKRFQPLQNRDAFKFFDIFLHDKDATLDAAGSLRGGRRIWINAKITGLEADIGKGDTIQGYLTLAHGHDGTLAVSIMFTPIRVVCMNTLRAALAEGLQKNARRQTHEKLTCIQLKHTKNLATAMDQTRMMINLASRSFQTSVEIYRQMSKVQIHSEGPKSLQGYVQKVFDVPPGEKMPRAWEFIEHSFENGPGATLRGVRGTVWGAYNSITDFIDHEKGRTEKARLENSWFGVGKTLRAKAFDEALALI